MPSDWSQSSQPFALSATNGLYVQGNILDFRATLYKFPPKPLTLSKPPAPWMCPGPTVAMSMEAVASSMMKMLVFLTKARARQNSCLWPWLKFSPPSVMMASEISPRRGAGLSESWVVSRVNSVAWGTGAQKCQYRSKYVSVCGESTSVEGCRASPNNTDATCMGYNEKSEHPMECVLLGPGRFW